MRSGPARTERCVGETSAQPPADAPRRTLATPGTGAGLGFLILRAEIAQGCRAAEPGRGRPSPGTSRRYVPGATLTGCSAPSGAGGWPGTCSFSLLLPTIRSSVAACLLAPSAWGSGPAVPPAGVPHTGQPGSQGGAGADAPRLLPRHRRCNSRIARSTKAQSLTTARNPAFRSANGRSDRSVSFQGEGTRPPVAAADTACRCGCGSSHRGMRLIGQRGKHIRICRGQPGSRQSDRRQYRADHSPHLTGHHHHQ
jgi:hypothetical protein